MSILVEERQGYYFGTEIDQKWWRRFRKKGFFARGLGTYWIDTKGIHFLKYLVENPFSINFSDIKDVKTGKWHSGRWGHGHPVTKILWTDGGEKVLSSGFILSKNKSELERICSLIRSHSGIKT